MVADLRSSTDVHTDAARRGRKVCVLFALVLILLWLVVPPDLQITVQIAAHGATSQWLLPPPGLEIAGHPLDDLDTRVSYRRTRRDSPKYLAARQLAPVWDTCCWQSYRWAC